MSGEEATLKKIKELAERAMDDVPELIEVLEAFEKWLRQLDHDARLAMVEDDIVTYPENEDILIANYKGKTSVLIPIKMILGDSK